MRFRPGRLAFALLIAVPLAAASGLPAGAHADEPARFTLQAPRLTLSSDFLPLGDVPDVAEADPPPPGQAASGAGAPAGQPQGPGLVGRRPMTQGSWEAGILLGRMLPGPGGPNLQHITFDKKFPKGAVRGYWLFPRIGYTFWEMPWYPGSFQVYLEPAVAYLTTPSHAYALGVSIFLRHTLLVWRVFSPYIEAGAGLMNTNLRNQVLGDSIQFMLMPGVGFHVNVFERLSLDVGYRYQHISDAGMTGRNRGVNSHLPYIGITHFF